MEDNKMNTTTTAMTKEEIQKRLTPFTNYLFVDNTKIVDRKDFFTVIKTTINEEGRVAAEKFAKTNKLKLSGGSFYENAIPYNFDSNYTVLDCGYEHPLFTDEKLTQYQDVASYALRAKENNLIWPFVEKPCEFSEIILSNYSELLFRSAEGNLSRKEKDNIFESIRNCSCKKAIKLRGWMFDFSSILNEYLVAYTYGDVETVFAPDKISIRNNTYYSNIASIKEIKDKCAISENKEIHELIEAIESNIEHINESNFNKGAKGLAPVIKLQFISEELENIKKILEK